jgi:acyl-CoA thioester hydrolase
MGTIQGELLLRVRYSETDQAGIYYNSRALEWFECGRSELLRSLGMSYREMQQRGIIMPVTEAHVKYVGRAQYDDQLRVVSTLSMVSKTRFRFDMEIKHAESGKPVCRGWTVHVATDASGRPIRPPPWLLELLAPLLA